MKKQRKLWTKEENDYLRQNYPYKNYTEISNELNRAKSSVYNKINRLGLRIRVRDCGKKWTREEEEYLKNNYLTKNNKELGKSLGKAASSVKGKIRRLGLKRPNRIGRNIESRERQSKTRKRLFNEGKLKTWNKGIPQTEEVKKKISKSKKGKNYKEKFGIERATQIKEKMRKSMIGKNAGEANGMYECGENHPNWQGGISFEPYGVAFNERFREMVRERDNRCCVVCNKPQEELGYKLHVHHSDYIKINNFPQNCVSLCRSCHTKTGVNRTHWKKFFQSLLKERHFYKYDESQKIIFDFIKES